MFKNIEVKIFKPVKSAMQSGKAKDKWFVEPISYKNHRELNQLMGWVSSNSTTYSQLHFEFNSKEEAIEFAKEYGLKYSVYEPNVAVFKRKSYSENFTN